MIGIYKVTNPKGAIYIGQSSDILFRFKEYEKLNCERQTKLYRSLKKYGFENHKFEIITECDIEQLNNLERYYQDLYNVLDRDFGLNLKLTNSDDRCVVLSEETKKKISEKLKNRTLSDWHRQILIDANTGRVCTEETKRKISEHFKGKNLSEDHKQKLSENHHTKKDGFVHHFKGKKHSDESRLKMSKNSTTSKMVIDLETGFIYDSATEAWKYNQDYLKVKNSMFKHKLNGICKNNTKFQYI
jgi:group I intron endonuclease